MVLSYDTCSIYIEPWFEIIGFSLFQIRSICTFDLCVTSYSIIESNYQSNYHSFPLQTL